MKKLAALLILFTMTQQVLCQKTIDLIESTLKIAALSEEVLYFGFAEGDQLILNFVELNDKELKEIEIMELNSSSSKFMDYKTTKIENKQLTISTTGIYKIRLSNSAVTGRICKLKIQRISASPELDTFNSTVYWRTRYDTTYTTVEERYLISKDTAVHNLTDRVELVHSQTNLNGSKNSFSFTLPAHTVAWSYYVGVDQAGHDAYTKATKDLTKYAAPVVLRIPGYGPLAALALGGASYITQLSAGEDIDYYIVDSDNVNLFLSGYQFYYIKKGKVINDFSQMTSNLKGTYHFCLSNDNAITGVSVTVKVTAVTVTENWGTRSVEKIHIAERQEPYLKN